MTTPLFTSAILAKGQSWTNSDAANTKKDLTAVASGNGMLIAAAIATNTDTSNAYLMDLFLNDGTTDWLLGSVSVPAKAGTDGITSSQNLLVALLIQGLSLDGTLAIPSGWKLRAAPTTQVASTQTLSVVTNGGQL